MLATWEKAANSCLANTDILAHLIVMFVLVVGHSQSTETPRYHFKVIFLLYNTIIFASCRYITN